MASIGLEPDAAESRALRGNKRLELPGFGVAPPRLQLIAKAGTSKDMPLCGKDEGGTSKMQERTLVAFISAGGATEQYAHIIADTLRSRGHVVDAIDLKREKVPDLSSYENAVVGTGVRIGMVYRKGKKFLRRKDLKGKRLGIFLSSGIAIESAEKAKAKAKAKFLEPLVEKYGLHPVMCDAFPGKIPGSGGKTEEGMDPEVARRWAEELALRLNEPA